MQTAPEDTGWVRYGLSLIWAQSDMGSVRFSGATCCWLTGLAAIMHKDTAVKACQPMLYAPPAAFDVPTTYLGAFSETVPVASFLARDALPSALPTPLRTARLEV